MSLARGVTFLVCTHNGGERLKKSLADLARQKARHPWELILVDNASTDDTLQRAQALWRELGSPAPARFLHEPRIGKTHAFWTGVAAARFEALTVVDDDNGLAEGWIDLAVAELERDPEVAGICPQGEVVYDTPLPDWYDENCWSFAVVRDMPVGRLDFDRTGQVPGAAVTLRTCALQELASRGFRQFLLGRIGASYDAPGGEDIEIHLALFLCGWRFVYQPKLRFKHYLAAGRICWANIRAMARCNGKCEPTFVAYQNAIHGTRRARPKRLRLRSRWQWQLGISLLKMAASVRGAWHLWRGTEEGVNSALRFEKNWTRVLTLLSMREEYQRRLDAVAFADWWPSRILHAPPSAVDKVA